MSRRLDFSDPAVIAALTAALEAAGVDGIEIVQGATRLRIVVESGNPARTVALQQQHTAGTVNAPVAGIFTSRHPVSDAPCGEIAGFIQVGPILVPVRTTAAGTPVQAIAADGALVGYGDPLFEIGTRP